MSSDRTMRTRSSCRCSQKLIFSGGVAGMAMVLGEKGPASRGRPVDSGGVALLLVLVHRDVFLHGICQFLAGLLELLDALAQALAQLGETGGSEEDQQRDADQQNFHHAQVAHGALRVVGRFQGFRSASDTSPGRSSSILS